MAIQWFCDPVSQVGANTAELRIMDGTYEILDQYCGGRWGRLEIKQELAGLLKNFFPLLVNPCHTSHIYIYIIYIILYIIIIIYIYINSEGHTNPADMHLCGTSNI